MGRALTLGEALAPGHSVRAAFALDRSGHRPSNEPMRRQIGVLRFLFFSILLFGPLAAKGEPSDLPRQSEEAFPLTDPNVFLSPYCWRIDARGSAICPAAGGYLKFGVTGTSRIVLRVNTAINRGMTAAHMPCVKVVVNGPALDGVARYYQFPGDNDEDEPIAVASGLDPRLPYQVLIHATGADELQMSGWSGTIFQTQINRIVVDGGASLLPASLRPKRALFLGASYEQAYFGMQKLDRSGVHLRRLEPLMAILRRVWPRL